MSEYMIFCLGEGKSESKGIGYQQNNMIFNKKVTNEEFTKWKNIFTAKIKLAVTLWIDKKDMTSDEKDEVSGWSEMGGYLKNIGYEESWTKWWNEAKKEDKDLILNCPHFDGKIFTGITGIKDFASKSLSGKTVSVTIDGQTYEAIVK